MKQQLSTLVVLAALAALPATAQTLYISQDVPTNPGPGNQMPWEVESHNLGNYVNQLALPGNPRIDAVHRMDQPGNWLVSLEHPSNLGGNLPSVALGRDVIQYDAPAGAYSFFFCGGSVVGSVGRHTNVDAIYLEAATGADNGDLIVSFDVPTEIAPTTSKDEGSYGTSNSGGVLMDRPQPAAAIDRCVVDQTLTAC